MFQRVAGFLDQLRVLGVVLDVERGDVLRRQPFLVFAEHDFRPQDRDPFGDQRLRRPDQENRLLEPTLIPHQGLLLRHLLRVVPWIGLVRRELGREVGSHRHVGVDRDPAAQASEVVVVRRPRLVGDVLELDALVLREADEGFGPRA